MVSVLKNLTGVRQTDKWLVHFFFFGRGRPLLLVVTTRILDSSVGHRIPLLFSLYIEGYCMSLSYRRLFTFCWTTWVKSCKTQLFHKGINVMAMDFQG